MKTDYKFWYIKRDDYGYIKEVAVRFHEGNNEIKLVEDIEGNLVEKEVYVRSKRLQTEKELSHVSSKRFIPETNGKLCVLYHENHFGRIKTDEELDDFLKKEISKDPGREVINKQKIPL